MFKQATSASEQPRMLGYVAGGIAFYAGYVGFTVLVGTLHLKGAGYHGSPEQARHALSMLTVETGLWGLPLTLVQAVSMAWTLRRVRRLPLATLAATQVGLAVISVLLSNVVSMSEAVLFTPIALTTVVYGFFRRFVALD